MIRKIIAIAELIGLPHANAELLHSSESAAGQTKAQSAVTSLEQRASLWEAICATDRNFSLMLNFPAGTARYPFPRNESMYREGVISPQAYNFRLSKICTAIFEIDESYMHGSPLAESYEKVLGADRQLRALATEAPKGWWHDSDHRSVAELLVQFWHFYFLARVHLRPGILGKADEQYAYNSSACVEACRNAVLRFPNIRLRIPIGFFVCRVLDLQVFTAATFLLLSERSRYLVSQSESPNTATDMERIKLVQQVIDCFASVSERAGSDLAHEAKAALERILELVQHPDARHQEPLTLQIPLLGKITLGRNVHSATSRSDMDSNENLELASDYDHPGSTSESAFDPLSWSFDFDSPSLLNEMLGMNFWTAVDQESVIP